MPEVSIIMPLYNAVRYVGAALDSILAQSFRDFELLIIDDGSSDGSAGICETYAARDGRIRILHQKNRGISAARNRGISEARGRWIAFCDHDDIYRKDYLQTAVRAGRRFDADLVKFEYTSERQNESGETVSCETGALRNRIYTYRDLPDSYPAFNLTVRAMWNGLYRAERVRESGVTFDESMKSGLEDYSFNLRYLPHCRTVCTLGKMLYVHYVRPNQSAFLAFSEEKLGDIIRAGAMEIDFLDGISGLANTPLIRAMHNAVFLSLYLDQLNHGGHNLLSAKEKESRLRALAASDGIYARVPPAGLAALARENWKYALKLALFSSRRYQTLILYTELNGRRKNLHGKRQADGPFRESRGASSAARSHTQQ